MALIDTLKSLLGSAWHVNSDAALAGLLPATDGTVEASKPITTDANKAVTGLGALTTTGALLNSAGGVGYATGAGGIVTQASNRTTGVTLNKLCGQITTNNASLAAGATAKFTVTNSQVGLNDTVDLTLASGSTTDQTDVKVQAVAAGSFDVVVGNRHASTAETGALVLNFAVTKGVIA